MREGHEFSWFVIDEQEEKVLKRCLKGLVPPPLEGIPKFEKYDLCIFDSTGHPDLAEESRAKTPTIGDGLLASRLEDDRLYGIETMEQCGIEVPPYTVCLNPDEAREYIKERPKRYVYKPFEPEEETEHQESDVTYVSDSADDMLRVIDKLFVRALEQPFILQEVVEGTEVSTEAYFDGQNFHLPNFTIEEKKFMSGGHGPNTGCAGNLMVYKAGPSRLWEQGLLKTVPFLREMGFHGIIDLNTIVNEHHAYGLEWTPRFGYDCCPTFWGMVDGNMGHFLYDIATGNMQNGPYVAVPQNFGASRRYSIPPYPTEVPGKHIRGLPISGVELEDAWHDMYLYDAMAGEEGQLVTAGITGFIGCPIARGYSPEAAWDGVERVGKGFDIPNMQMRDDLRESTIKRLCKLEMMRWL